MKIGYKFLIVCLIALSCNSDDDQLIPFCSEDNPVVDLAWLKAEIEQREQNITDDSKYCYIFFSYPKISISNSEHCGYEFPDSILS